MRSAGLGSATEWPVVLQHLDAVLALQPVDLGHRDVAPRLRVVHRLPLAKARDDRAVEAGGEAEIPFDVGVHVLQHQVAADDAVARDCREGGFRFHDGRAVARGHAADHVVECRGGAEAQLVAVPGGDVGAACRLVAARGIVLLRQRKGVGGRAARFVRGAAHERRLVAQVARERTDEHRDAGGAVLGEQPVEVALELLEAAAVQLGIERDRALARHP
jgi:hypothetical protein